MPQADTHLRYKRSRFSTRLPLERRYTNAHMWLWSQGDDAWRIGFTKFALRMLGEPVEFDFEVQQGATVETGQVIGWIEGFKAVTDVYCPMPGTFAGANPDLTDDIALIKSAPYERGWLFQVRGEPDETSTDAQGYVNHLDATIDRMLGEDS
jgi:glycine cleavage system H protein